MGISRFTHVAFFDASTKVNGAAFLREVVEAFRYRIHAPLPDDGMAFADLPQNRNGPTRRYLGARIFDRVFHSPDLAALKARIPAFVRACNFANHLKALG